ncbi:FAD-dependent oxidoreductase [Mycobacterium spongiae]|uniref:Pyridine nucleotide-disulfide oxidoreductase n=1 Tax=Mycobacterium spongiae TaxID=886343 RepID=A0A975JY02_9MYCO|nr:FAD-dependent oxidoreductase [Mycobacterium spongiae]QUR67762.1 pyridine nucleotide-disulfide oxidoreductase [Mycobacterium spongiae]
MTGKRVIIAGLGDTGVLTAIHLSGHADVVGISVKPALVSGQELGMRLSRPDAWARDYWISFDRFRGLDRVRTIQAALSGVDLADRAVFARHADGSVEIEHYDALVIATGVTNGFWRRPDLQSADQIGAELQAAHDRLAAARSVVVVGGGAAAVSSAANIATVWPNKWIGLYYPGERPLADHHPRVWRRVRRRLSDAGVVLRPGHRAAIPNGFGYERITSEPVAWRSGQAPTSADAVLWAIGQVRPNTDWLPPELLDDEGFVRVTPQLRVPDHHGVFAVGDVAATDRLRSSARNRADRLVAHNVRAEFAGRSLRSYRAPNRRWGSVLGVQADGLEVFAPSGLRFRFPAWSIDRVLQPWIVRRGIYHGIRRPRTDEVG